MLAVVASVGSLTFWLATQLTGVSLYPALAALAVLGLVLPWIMLTAMRCIEAVR